MILYVHALGGLWKQDLQSDISDSQGRDVDALALAVTLGYHQ